MNFPELGGGYSYIEDPVQIQEAVDAAVGGGKEPFFPRWGEKDTSGLYANIPYDGSWWSRVKLHPDVLNSPERMHAVYMEHGHPDYQTTNLSVPSVEGTAGISLPGLGAGLPGEPGATTPVVDPVQEAIDQIVTPPVEVEEEVGGGTLPTDEDFSMGLPEGHPFFQSPEYLAWQEQGGIGTMDVAQASDGTWFSSGTTAGLYDKWLANQQNQTDPGTGVVDTGTGTVDTGEGPDPTPDIQALIDEWWAGIMAEQEAQQTAQDTARQTAIDQAAAMTGQYTLTGPSIGYNPYESGQYASSPYGTAGVPEMGGITTIPVPATYKAPGTT